MNLFNEIENKYYELISYLVCEKKDFGDIDLQNAISKYLCGEADFEVIDTLFAKAEGDETVFIYENGVYSRLIEQDFPVRCNNVEKQALCSLPDLEYTNKFLSISTIEKIINKACKIEKKWDIQDIKVKNQYKSNNTREEEYHSDLAIIKKAIEEHKAIMFDNIKPNGAVALKN